MNKRLMALTTEQVQELQDKRRDRLYAAMNANKYEGELKDRLLAKYEETVQLLLARLGEHAYCGEIDSDTAQLFSDCYKDTHNFRPRGFTYAMMLKWMEMNMTNVC